MSLLDRAATLLPPTEFDLALEKELGDALVWTGRSDEALRRADALAERASAAGDQIGELCGRIMASEHRTDLEPENATESLALIEQALRVFQAAGDDLALYIAYHGFAAITKSWDAALDALERAAVHARQAGHASPSSLGWRAGGRFFGTTPVSELLAWLDENEPPAGRDHFLRAYRAGALAMLGRFDEARTILAETRAEVAERGGGVLLANITAGESVWVELWAGDPAAAAEFGAEGWRLCEELGERSWMQGKAGDLAEALYALDRLDEADAWAGRAAELDTSAWKWRQVKAKVLARRGEHAEGERLAREAVAIAEEHDSLDRQGDAYADLAEVLALAGKPDEAASALEQALERYERKENRVSAQRARERLAKLQAATPR